MFVAVSIEDPSGHALDNFHDALRSAETKQGTARIAFYGASHVAADIFTDVIRRRLQTRFGEAGAGFAMPAKPLTHYRLASIAFENSTGWSGAHARAGNFPVDRYGLAGMYVVSGRKTARSAFATRAHAGVMATAAEVELYYWKQPKGGRFRFTIDDKPHSVNTRARKPTTGYAHFKLPDTDHRFEIATRGDGPVQLFGMTLERNVPGVVLDTLGIPGARAANQLQWDLPLLREHLRRRPPNLLVLAYGTNECGDDAQPIEDYAANLRVVLTRMHEIVPRASCLLVGPSDRPVRNEDGTFSDRPRTAQIIDTQRKVSAEFGCGFFDLVAFMGGPMSMPYWVEQENPFGAPDYVHFTFRGYEALGNVLYDGLVAGYSTTLPDTPPVAAEDSEEPIRVDSDTLQTP